MKQEEQDILQRKINKLDTLSAGIVFGKEQAWDKLQARMEHKPARKIAFRYWAAAAALLLVLVCVSVFYHQPVQDVVKITSEKPGIPGTNTTPTALSQATDAIPGPQYTSRVSVPAKRPAPARKELQAEEVNSVVQVPITAKEEEKEQTIIVTNPPAPVVATPMKVYHINDLELGAAPSGQPAVAAIGDEVDLQHLPTMHINEVIRQDVEIKNIRRENRMSWGPRLFSKPELYAGHRESATPAEDYIAPRNPLKAILNIQN